MYGAVQPDPVEAQPWGATPGRYQGEGQRRKLNHRFFLDLPNWIASNCYHDKRFR